MKKKRERKFFNSYNSNQQHEPDQSDQILSP